MLQTGGSPWTKHKHKLCRWVLCAVNLCSPQPPLTRTQGEPPDPPPRNLGLGYWDTDSNDERNIRRKTWNCVGNKKFYCRKHAYTTERCQIYPARVKCESKERGGGEIIFPWVGDREFPTWKFLVLSPLGPGLVFYLCVPMKRTVFLHVEPHSSHYLQWASIYQFNNPSALLCSPLQTICCPLIFLFQSPISGFGKGAWW